MYLEDLGNVLVMNENTNDLIKCGLCGETIPYQLGCKKAWQKDRDTNKYYCPECKKIFINNVDMDHTA